MEVIPASLIDQPTPVHNVRTRTFFIVDGRQDEAVLKDALDSLIRDHWRKLGARLVRRAKDGFLEYHLPKTFADDYSLFRWSSTHLEKSIDTCPELSFYNNPPPAENGISFLPSMWSIDKVVRPASWPMERKEEPPNDPLLYVHLTVFTDATVIATSIPHALADQFGVGNIMRAWFGLTRGETPPAMVGHDEDIMASVGKDVSEYSREEISRKGKARLQWPLESLFVMLGFLGDLIWYPSERSHIVFFPRSFVQQLRARYSKELEAKYGADPGLSSGDVILGVLAKFSRMHDRKPRTMALMQVINLRGRIPQLMSDEESYGYIHNAKSYGTGRVPVTSSTPAREIAYQSRQIIKEGMQQKEYEITQSVLRERVRRRQHMLICEPFDRTYGTTNWCRAWKGLTLGNSSKEMLVLGQSTERSIPGRFICCIMSQTKEGFWCEFAAPAKAITLIEEHLKKDPLLENF